MKIIMIVDLYYISYQILARNNAQEISVTIDYYDLGRSQEVGGNRSTSSTDLPPKKSFFVQ